MFQRIKFEWVVILIILALFVFRECSRPLLVDSSAHIYADSIKYLKSQKTTLQALQATIISEAREREKEDSSKLVESMREISRLKIKASKARTPRVDTLLIENPELKVFVEAQDSVILVQAVLIDTLKSNLEFERNVREQLVALHYDQAKIESQMSELKDQRIIALEKDLKKERRRGRFLKVVAIVGSIAAFIGGSQL